MPVRSVNGHMTKRDVSSAVQRTHTDTPYQMYAIDLYGLLYKQKNICIYLTDEKPLQNMIFSDATRINPGLVLVETETEVKLSNATGRRHFDMIRSCGLRLCRFLMPADD